MTEDVAPRARRVVVADDDTFTRSLVGDGLRSAGFEVAVATTAEKAWQLVSEWDPHALVSDLNFEAGGSGAELLRRVEHEFPWVGLVILTSHVSPELAVIDGGDLPSAAVYLVKSRLSGVGDLEEAVEHSIAGLEQGLASPEGDRTHVITPAQAEVLRMLASGASTKALAEHRNTTTRAVETMVARLYTALGLGSDELSNSRVAAVRMWERGMVSVRGKAD